MTAAWEGGELADLSATTRRGGSTAMRVPAAVSAIPHVPMPGTVVIFSSIAPSMNAVIMSLETCDLPSENFTAAILFSVWL
jgi:hypothetical protein